MATPVPKLNNKGYESDEPEKTEDESENLQDPVEVHAKI